MSQQDAIQKLEACVREMLRKDPSQEVFATQHIIIAYHVMHGGKHAVAELCRAFGVRCSRGIDICGTCATAGMNAAMDALDGHLSASEGNAPSTSTPQ